MRPVDFEESNMDLVAPEGLEGKVAKLRVWRGPTDGGLMTVSCWEFSAEDLHRVLEGGRLWLMVQGDYHPPVAMTTEHPFTWEEGS